jgi:hypothetical protein
MRVYVAGAGAEIERAERAILELVRLGHEITHDWTLDVRRAMRARTGDGDLSDDRARKIAGLDLDGVRDAAVVLFLAPPAGRGAGCWVELGYALGCRRAHKAGLPRLLVSGRVARRYLFCRLADVSFRDDVEALAWFDGAK